MKKTWIWLVLLVLLALAGGVWWFSGNFERLLRGAIATHGSAMAGAPVSVQRIEIDPGSGQGALHGLLIGNPSGFQTPHALRVERVAIDIDLSTVTQEVVHIRRIEVIAPDVIYEKGESLTNFEALQRHINTALGPRSTPAAGEKEKRFTVGEFTVQGAQAQASAAFMQGRTVSVKLPDIVLRDIGKAQGGVTAAQLGQTLAQAMQQKLAASVRFDRLAADVGKQMGQALDKAGQALKGLLPP